MVTDCERHHGEHEPAEAVARAPERLEKLLWGGALSCDLKKEVGLSQPCESWQWGCVTPTPVLQVPAGFQPLPRARGR